MSFTSPEVIIQILVALFGAGGVSVLVGAWRDKRKADAEASKEDATAADIIEGASGRQVLRFEKEIKDLQRERDDERQVNKDQRELNRKLIENIRAREEWEREVVIVTRQAGIALRPPPTLVL